MFFNKKKKVACHAFTFLPNLITIDSEFLLWVILESNNLEKDDLNETSYQLPHITISLEVQLHMYNVLSSAETSLFFKSLATTLKAENSY